jgi:hypothetical protein
VRVVLVRFCGGWLASDGGLTADLFFADVLNLTVGVSLLAMRPAQPPNLSFQTVGDQDQKLQSS